MAVREEILVQLDTEQLSPKMEKSSPNSLILLVWPQTMLPNTAD